MQPNAAAQQGRAGGNLRRAGRVRVHMIGCQLGELLDLSANGARVVCKGRAVPQAGDAIRIGIDGLDGCIEIPARVAWARKLGWFSHELGLEFVDIDAATRRALTAVARTAPANQTFGVDHDLRASA